MTIKTLIPILVDKTSILSYFYPFLCTKKYITRTIFSIKMYIVSDSYYRLALS